MKKKTKSKNKINIIINIIIALLLVFSSLYFIFISKNFIPNKYYYLIFILLLIICFIKIINIIKGKNKGKLNIFFNILIVLFSILLLFISVKIKDTYLFLNNNFNNKYTKDVYVILVNKNSKYKTIDNIDGKKIYGYKGETNKSKIRKILSNKTSARLNFKEENVTNLFKDILTDRNEVVLVNEGYYDLICENMDNYLSSVRVLDTITVKTKIKNENNTNSDLTTKPFVIYLSGIDTRTNSLPFRSLSDVNIIMAVNPVKKKILLIHIPRDYYVMLHGTSGLRDKLTHAGTYGGIIESMSTIEDLLDIDISYYIRINFNSVVKLVNIVGGN